MSDPSGTLNPTDSCNLHMSREDWGIRTIVAVNVDNMSVAGSSADCDPLHELLHKRSPTNNLGDPTHYTGYNHKHHRNNTFDTVSQQTVN